MRLDELNINGPLLAFTGFYRLLWQQLELGLFGLLQRNPHFYPPQKYMMDLRRLNTRPLDQRELVYIKRCQIYSTIALVAAEKKLC